MSTWLTLICLVATMPLLAFSVAIVHSQIIERQDEARATLVRRAASTARGVGRELRGIANSLKTMSEAGSVQRGDLDSMYKMASRVVLSDTRLQSISLSEDSGRVHFSTSRPFGTELPESPLKDQQRK